MTTEHTTRHAVPQDGAVVLPLPVRAGPQADADLRERLGEFRALLVISLLMTESAHEDQILELATSSAAGLGPWQIEGYRFTDGQWHPGLGRGTAAPPGLAGQLAALGSKGGPVSVPGRGWAWAYPLRGVGRPARPPGRLVRGGTGSRAAVPDPGAGPADRGGGVQRPAARPGAGHRG